eukprot:200383-Prymnesium_polylepis.1
MMSTRPSSRRLRHGPHRSASGEERASASSRTAASSSLGWSSHFERHAGRHGAQSGQAGAYPLAA